MYGSYQLLYFIIRLGSVIYKLEYELDIILATYMNIIKIMLYSE